MKRKLPPKPAPKSPPKIAERHPTGFPKAVGRFDSKNVNREGQWVFFNGYGRAEEIGSFLRNKPTGTWRRIDWKNAKIYEFSYHGGKATKPRYVGKLTPEVVNDLPDAFFEFRSLVGR